MLMKMCWAITAMRWAGFRNAYGSRFPRYCCSLSSRSSNRLLGPPEIQKPNIYPSYCTRDNFQHPPPSSTDRDFSENCFEDPHPCIDLFIQINEDSKKSPYFMQFRLDRSWNHDSLTTLKIIAYMKRVSNVMKQCPEQFNAAALWLHSNHPKSLADNVKVFSEFGCLKDWLEVLYCLVKGPLFREMENKERKRAQRERVTKLSKKRLAYEYQQWHEWNSTEETKGNQDDEDEFYSREKWRIHMARVAVEMYYSDPNYRYLHDKVSDLFAEHLKSDLEFMKSGDLGKISLAAKWCPSIGSSYDRSTLICESIARRLFPYDSNPEYEGLEEAHYVYRIRHCLQKRVLVPLRRALNLPEIYMSRNEWNSLPYDRVKFTAMKTYKRLFIKHDQERFLQYTRDLEDAKKRKITSGSGREMFPHDILSLLNLGYDGEFVEAQWRSMVNALSEKGKFKNCIVAFDLREMEAWRTPKLVVNFSLSFQLLASDLSDSPWNGTVLRQIETKDPYEHKTELLKIEGDDLQSKMEYLKSLRGEYCTFVQVWELLDKILETAVCCNISREKMVRRLFVFDLGGCWDDDDSTDIEAKRKKFEDSGYTMPEIVFWDMGHWGSHCEASRVKFHHKDVMSVKGLSRRSIKVFLEKDGKLEMNTMLDSQISGEEYMTLKVFD